ncbi:MAG: FumA C-terminus/TtdB family hydratase beta subunit [Desulfobulbaceae bacterium]|nr:FumA C-terminus/TtdB family hydratase beta subunit [Desulfobulbaceae bacterium]
MSLLRANTNITGNFKKIKVPFEQGTIESLNAGDLVHLSGTIYTGRDLTHRLLCELLDQNKALPVDLKGQLLYYVGPSPARPGKIIGAAGPTSSYRMDLYTPRLLELGLPATLGKGRRSEPVKIEMKNHGAIYLATFGGAGALLSQCIKKIETIAFPEAGPEAMFRMDIENFPAVVINDINGRDYFEEIRCRKNND